MTKKIYGWWQAVFLLGLLIMPFVYWLHARVGYEVPRGWMLMGWVEVLLGIAVFGKISRRRLGAMATYWWLVFGIMAVASLAGVDPVKSIVGNYYRSDGLLTYLHLWLLATMVGWYGNRNLFYKSAVVVMASVVGLSVWGLVVYLFGWPALGTTKWVGGGMGLSFGNPNYLVGFVALSMPLVWWVGELWRRRWGKWVRLVSLFPLLLMVLSGSRAGWLVLGLFWLMVWIVLTSKKSVRWVVGLVMLAGILLSLRWVLEDTQKTFTTLGYESRERIVRKILLGWQQRPWLGYGWANSDKAFDVGVWPYAVQDDVYVDKAHSTLLEYLVTTGAIGMGAYLVFLLLVGKHLLTRKKNEDGGMERMTLGMGFLMYVLHAQMNIVGTGEEVVWMILLGFSWSMMSRDR